MIRMAKVFYDTIGDRDNVYQAAEFWKEKCLLQNYSILFGENHELWTLNNLQTLKTRFNDNPMHNDHLTFDKKFEFQLQGVSQEIYQLAMEVIYIYYLFPSSGTVSYRTKLLKIKDIASWGKVPYDTNHLLLEALELGIGATGTYYNTAKFEEISYIIQFAITVKNMPVEERHSLITDPWELKKIIADTKIKIGKNVQVQHILSHLLAPDYFECMASAGHKSLIVKNFKKYIQNQHETDIDKQLYEIRRSLEAEGRYDPINFYHNKELMELWKPNTDKTNDNGGKDVIKDPPTTYNIAEVMNITNLGNLVFENEDILQGQIQTALKSGKHIIFTGPPGTGKSKLAGEICKQIGVSKKLVTATSNWTTYDTIGGYKPNKNGELFFDPGLFLQCFKNKEGNNINDWLIIDEINRADIDKAFGPLFSVLTGDEVTLSYQSREGIQIVLKPQSKVNGNIRQDEYVVPNDWRIIGTMNTIDKSSLFEMSYAFMRRFAFIPVGVPKSITIPLVEQYLKAWSIQDYMHIEKLKTLWEIINEYRKFGPALVRDIAKYTAESEDDFTSAIILYVLPQFEGLSDFKIKEFVRRLHEKLGDTIASNLLNDFIEDFFQIGTLDEA